MVYGEKRAKMLKRPVGVASSGRPVVTGPLNTTAPSWYAHHHWRPRETTTHLPGPGASGPWTAGTTAGRGACTTGRGAGGAIVASAASGMSLASLSSSPACTVVTVPGAG